MTTADLPSVRFPRTPQAKALVQATPISRVSARKTPRSKTPMPVGKSTRSRKPERRHASLETRLTCPSIGDNESEHAVKLIAHLGSVKLVERGERLAVTRGSPALYLLRRNQIFC